MLVRSSGSLFSVTFRVWGFMHSPCIQSIPSCLSEPSGSPAFSMRRRTTRMRASSSRAEKVFGT